MHKLIFLAAFVLALGHIFNMIPRRGEVLGATTAILPQTSTIENKVVLATQTAFSQKEITQEETLPFDTTYEKDATLDYGTEKVNQEGQTGKKTYYYLITHWGDEEIDRVLKNTTTQEPVTQIIANGTKITWRLLEGTEHGRLRYWYKLRVWATKYDANCFGCTGRTYSGTAVKKGVCATDPKVISLGTNFYVEGYGLCRAEDIGGAIKGNKIDLGFEDASKGAWGAAYTTIYLLTNAPE